MGLPNAELLKHLRVAELPRVEIKRKKSPVFHSPKIKASKKKLVKNNKESRFSVSPFEQSQKGMQFMQHSIKIDLPIEEKESQKSLSATLKTFDVRETNTKQASNSPMIKYNSKKTSRKIIINNSDIEMIADVAQGINSDSASNKGEEFRNTQLT